MTFDYPRIATEDRADAVVPLSHKEAKTVDSKVDRWRRENVNDVKSWDTKRGHVVQWGGFRVYYGKCRDCSGLVTTRRDIRRYKEGETNIGRWPLLCGPCRTQKAAANADAPRERMRRLRAKRYAERDAQLEKLGLPPIKQGSRTDLI
ncbi:hypothetical protein [Rhodococcus opacus]|uniref:hypothetical protein n=1 Tax=Rhodococcus opacus TaxID=37919 RepID=UPI0022357509|nr:hypothetical protein [Rhodococcus opacus]UZG58238.1 hypothetical protein ONE62_13365 [Rhodococcus opacus]